MILKLLFIKFQIIRIILTYDDGPTSYTEEILYLLNQYNIRAIFFPIICNDNKRNKILQKLKKSNMIIGNHTFCHTELFSSTNKKQVQLAIKKQHDFLVSKNIVPVIFRYPSGIYNKRAISLLKELEYKIILFWDTFVYKRTKPRELYRSIVLSSSQKQKSIFVVLVHDCFPNSIEATKVILENFHYKLYFVENKIVFFVIAPPETVFTGGCNNGVCVNLHSFTK